MPKRIRLESEKAETRLSDLVLNDPMATMHVTGAAHALQTIMEGHGETFKRSGLCALRDACNVLIAQGMEEDAAAQSEYVEALKAAHRDALQMMKEGK